MESTASSGEFSRSGDTDDNCYAAQQCNPGVILQHIEMISNDIKISNKGKGAGLWSDIESEDLSCVFTSYPLLTGPVHSCAISIPRRAYSPAAVSVNCNLCPTRYSFSLSQVKHLSVKCLAQRHNILTMSQD